MSTVKVRVIDGWAVHDGTRHRTGGEVVEVDADTAEQWITAGWAEKVAPRPTRTERAG